MCGPLKNEGLNFLSETLGLKRPPIFSPNENTY